jgi:hypothetical protein
MTPKKELQVATWLAAILLVVSVIGYAAAPVKNPDEPVRLMFKVVAGNVLFDHKAHASETGYGLACFDCHHHPEYPDDEAEALVACGECHQSPKEGEMFPESCLNCHASEDIEGTEVPNRSDAFHGQCETCHKESGIGPVKDEDRCQWCHFMM